MLLIKNQIVKKCLVTFFFVLIHAGCSSSSVNDELVTDTGTGTDTGTDTGTGSPPIARFITNEVIYPEGVTTVQWGDLDNDGDLDMFAAEGGAHRNGLPTLSWFEFPGWQKHEIGTPLTPFTGDSQLVDMDSDSDLDLVITVDSHSGANDTGQVLWYENNLEMGDWKQHIIESNVPSAFHLGDVAVGDIDGNGRIDVVVRHLSSYRFVAYFQQLDGSWVTKRIQTRDREGLALADLNKDGLMDIIGNGFVLFAPANPQSGTWAEVVIDSAFFDAPVRGLNNSVKAGVADIDNDGALDVLLSPAEGQAVYFAWYKVPDNPMTPNWERTIIETPSSNNHQVQTADIDLDGDIDIFGGFSFGDRGVVWWENIVGDGSEFTRHVISSTKGCYSCRTGDFDSDGDWDFAGPNQYVGQINLYENLSANHNGTFSN